jgi:membrane protein implicated in regulation of membrane protease activity
VVDGEWDEILEMPSSSPWPPLLAIALAGIFAMVLLKLWLAAVFFAVLVALVLVAWHGGEPQEA